VRIQSVAAAHDALAVHLQLIAHHRDLAAEFARELDDLGGRPRVESVLVDDLYFAFGAHRITE
jgi:hypothetical protein